MGVINQTAGKAEVAPCFIPTVLAGKYWVVGFNKTEGWALVSGGPPTIASADGCKTGTGENDSGLWIFTRQQQRDDTIIQKVRGIAKGKGYDLSVLKDVDHTNCTAETSTAQIVHM